MQNDVILFRVSIVTAPSRKIVWFFLFSGILLASAAIHPYHDGKFTICVIKNVFGIHCPGCGMTRAFLFLGHGDIRTALRLNINSLSSLPADSDGRMIADRKTLDLFKR